VLNVWLNDINIESSFLYIYKGSVCVCECMLKIFPRLKFFGILIVVSKDDV
jgi:hypothetical protein